MSSDGIQHQAMITGDRLGSLVRGRADILEAYQNILLCVVNKAPSISTHSISKSIDQIEHLVEAGHQTGGDLTALRPQINLMIMHMKPSALYELVAKDPVRFMNLAVPLRCRQLYDEALIHLAGSYPLWSSFATPAYTIDAAARKIVMKKANQLRELRERVDRAIILNLSQLGVSKHNPDPSKPAEFESWFLCNYVRHRFCQELIALQRRNPTCGQLYRDIGDGGEAFISADQVQSILNVYESELRFMGAVDSRTVIDDLKLMMKECVRELVRNNAHVRIEGAPFTHLTCTVVDEEDYPWHGLHGDAGSYPEDPEVHLIGEIARG